MAHWVLKAVLQRTLGALPNAHAVNEWFQKNVTRSLNLDEEYLTSKFEEARGHLNRYDTHGTRPLRTAVEVGTGWYPTLPLALWLAGADRVVTYDIAPLLTPSRARAALYAVSNHLEQNPEALPQALSHRVARLHDALASSEDTLEGILGPLGIEVIIGDASKTDLEDGSVDLVASTVVLEYIPEDVLVALFREGRRIAGHDGVHSHEIDLTDQFHYVDPSITPFHFLRFSDRAWSVIKNPIIPLTRLRHSDYVRALEAAGLCVADDAITRGSKADVEAVPLAPRFQAYASDDLRVTRSWVTMVAQTEREMA